MKDLKRASAHGVAWNLIQNLVGRLLGLAVVAILARYIDRSAFGAVALALAVIAFGELIVSQGYGEFIAQRPELDDAHIDTAFWLCGGLGVVLSLGIVLAAEPIATGFEDPALAPIVRWLALALLLRSFSVVPAGLLVRRMQFRTLSLRSLVAAAIGGVAGVVGAAAGMGIYALVLAAIVGDIASIATLWRATEWRPSLRFSTAHLRELFAFGSPILLATLLNFGSRRLDVIIVGGALGLAQLGVYSMAQRVYQILNQMLNKSGDTVALSALSRMAGDPEKRRDAFYKVAEINAVLCFPIYLGLSLVAAPMLATLFGPQWVDGAPAVVYFGISGLPLSLSYLHAAGLKAAGNTRGYLLIHVVLVMVYLPVLGLLVGHGPTGAALAYLIGCAAIMPVEIWLVRVALGIEWTTYARWLAGPSIATAVMAAATVAVARFTGQLVPPLELAVLVAVGGTSYVAGLRILAPATYRRCRDLVQGLRHRPSQPA